MESVGSQGKADLLFNGRIKKKKKSQPAALLIPNLFLPPFYSPFENGPLCTPDHFKHLVSSYNMTNLLTGMRCIGYNTRNSWEQ